MRRIAALLLCPLLAVGLLAACGGADSTDKGLPSVSGRYGDKPKVKADTKVKPGTKLKSSVLVQGKGPKVAKGDLLVADYLGSVYATNKVFDNSYDRGQPAGFEIGTGKVIKGWDETLVGVKAGSRVLMVIPPAKGYGTEGNPQAGIKGTDSLVFVVDVIKSYGKTATKSASASTPVTGLPATLPKVVGTPGVAPKITVAKGTTPPKAAAATVIAKGDGKPVTKGKLVVVQYTAVNFANESLDTTWEAGVPRGFGVGIEGQATPFDELVGIPVGSRVLLLLPAQQGGDPKKDSVAVAIDVLAMHGPAKEAA
ncbi:MAG: FKBP-type peptidyl-prolyl cis-trans isomerase [Sporichthyaceae bacterium]